MTTTTRYLDANGQPALPGEYVITDTRVRVTAITRPDGFTVDEQHAVIIHTVTADTLAVPCVHCGDSLGRHSEDREACVKAGYYGNHYTPGSPDSPDAKNPDTNRSTDATAAAVISAEQALADIRTAFDACFTPDFNGVDWRNDDAIQTLAATVYPILYRAATPAQETAP